MANKRMVTAASRAAKARREEAEYRKRVKYKLLRVGWDKDDEVVIPRNFTILSPADWINEFSVHEWKGTKGLRVPALCPLVHRDDSHECEYCESEGDYGPCTPKNMKIMLVYCHDFEGEIYRDEETGRETPWECIRVLVIGGAKGGINFERLEEAIDAGALNKRVWQLTRIKGKGTIMKALKRELRAKLGNQGRVPREKRQEVGELDFDEHLAHCLNVFKEVDWEAWEVDQPSISKQEAVDEEDQQDNSYADEDSDTDDEKEKRQRPRRKRRFERG